MLFDSLMGIRAALYTHFPEDILKGGFAGTAQFIIFGLHYLSLIDVC